MDRYKTILKEAEKERPTGKIEPLILPVKNKKFVKLIDELQKYSSFNQTLDRKSQDMLDNMRLTVLAKYFEQQDKQDDLPMYKWLYNKILSMASFRAYCGANTPILKLIEEDRDLVQPFKIDEICRTHDYSYSKAKTTDDIFEADKQMIKSIFEEYVIGKIDYETSSTVQSFLMNHLFQKTLPNIFKLVLTFNFVKNTPRTVKHVATNVKSMYNLREVERLDYENRIQDILESNRDIENQYILDEDTIKNAKSYTRELYKPYYKQFGYESGAGVIDFFWNLYGTGLIKDTFFSVVSLFAIASKMIFETSTGYQITNTLDEYSFDPFDIKKQIEEYLEYQNIRATELGLELEPFKSDVIEDVIAEEAPIKETDTFISTIAPVKSDLDKLIEQFLEESQATNNDVNSVKEEDMHKPTINKEMTPLDQLINDFLESSLEVSNIELNEDKKLEQKEDL